MTCIHIELIPTLQIDTQPTDRERVRVSETNRDSDRQSRRITDRPQYSEISSTERERERDSGEAHYSYASATLLPTNCWPTLFTLLPLSTYFPLPFSCVLLLVDLSSSLRPKVGYTNLTECIN